MELHVKSGGSGDRLYLLIHGQGCTADVWDGFSTIIDENRVGRWIAPDLRGHGRSEWADSYGVGFHAADVAGLVQGEEDVVIVGHSMGALIAIILATGIFDISPTASLGIGLKCDWPPEERKKLLAFAQKPARWFETREEAIDRYLLVSGLQSLVDPGSKVLLSSVVEGDEGFRLAADPRTVAVGGPPEGLIPATRTTSHIRLACGEHDTVTHIDGLRKLDPDAILIDGLGHNCHVEAPLEIWDLLTTYLTEI